MTVYIETQEGCTPLSRVAEQPEVRRALEKFPKIKRRILRLLLR